MTDRVTDPRPIPTPSVAALVFAIAVPLIYLLWVLVLIPIAKGGSTDLASEAVSLDVLRVITQAAAPLAVLLGIVGVATVRRDPHLYRWQWVGIAAIVVGLIEIFTYAGGWLGLWPTW
jgi:hypothetical protein